MSTDNLISTRGKEIPQGGAGKNVGSNDMNVSSIIEQFKSLLENVSQEESAENALSILSTGNFLSDDTVNSLVDIILSYPDKMSQLEELLSLNANDKIKLSNNQISGIIKAIYLGDVNGLVFKDKAILETLTPEDLIVYGLGIALGSDDRIDIASIASECNCLDSAFDKYKSKEGLYFMIDDVSLLIGNDDLMRTLFITIKYFSKAYQLMERMLSEDNLSSMSVNNDILVEILEQGSDESVKSLIINYFETQEPAILESIVSRFNSVCISGDKSRSNYAIVSLNALAGKSIWLGDEFDSKILSKAMQSQDDNLIKTVFLLGYPKLTDPSVLYKAIELQVADEEINLQTLYEKLLNIPNDFYNKDVIIKLAQLFLTKTEGIRDFELFSNEEEEISYRKDLHGVNFQQTINNLLILR